MLEADPFADVQNFTKVRCVFRAGSVIYSAKTP